MTTRDQVNTLIAAWQGFTEAGDADSIALLYTEDALILTQGHLPISGRQAIKEYFKESMGDGFKITIEAHDVQDRGDIVYAVGTYNFEDENGNWLEVYQRQSDGSLLFHRQCSNSQ